MSYGIRNIIIFFRALPRRANIKYGRRHISTEEIKIVSKIKEDRNRLKCKLNIHITKYMMIGTKSKRNIHQKLITNSIEI